MKTQYLRYLLAYSSGTLTASMFFWGNYGIDRPMVVTAAITASVMLFVQVVKFTEPS